jgi:hypothetical protein
MIEKSTTINKKLETRQKISANLRSKWQDPDFRSYMMSKIAVRKTTKGTRHNAIHREKISASMRAKWLDAEFRRKMDAANAKRKEQLAADRPISESKRKSAKNKSPATTRAKSTPVLKGSSSSGHKKAMDVPSLSTKATVTAIKPVLPRTEPRKKADRKRRSKKDSDGVEAVRAKPFQNRKNSPKPKPDESSDVVRETLGGDNLNLGLLSEGLREKVLSKKLPSTGSVDRLREERRDLYEFLYGDGSDMGSGSNLRSYFDLEDDNLDTFDPYGLENG